MQALNWMADTAKRPIEAQKSRNDWHKTRGNDN